jgi:hypothetical protein
VTGKKKAHSVYSVRRVQRSTAKGRDIDPQSMLYSELLSGSLYPWYVEVALGVAASAKGDEVADIDWAVWGLRRIVSWNTISDEKE